MTLPSPYASTPKTGPVVHINTPPGIIALSRTHGVSVDTHVEEKTGRVVIVFSDIAGPALADQISSKVNGKLEKHFLGLEIAAEKSGSAPAQRLATTTVTTIDRDKRTMTIAMSIGEFEVLGGNTRDIGNNGPSFVAKHLGRVNDGRSSGAPDL